MARTNRYASVNFNEIFEKKTKPNKKTTESATATPNSRIHGRMLVLSRPSPKPLQQTQSPQSQPDSVSLRPLGRTGESPPPSPAQETEEAAPAPPSIKFVPPHLRPGFAGREERFVGQKPRGGSEMDHVQYQDQDQDLPNSRGSHRSAAGRSFKSSSTTTRDEEIEALELLDEFWFFENLLHRRAGISRCSSDPYPSSINVKVLEQQHEEQKWLPASDDCPKVGVQGRRSLLRTPSLPPCIGREEVVKEKVSRRSNKLIRQSSMFSSEALPPLHVSKAQRHSNSMGRHQLKVERMTDESTEKCLLTRDAIYRSLTCNYKKSSKSLSELECEEVQGFKDLGFTFNEEDLNPSVVSIIPGLQVKKSVDRIEDKVTRPYLSEAWIKQKSMPRMPYNDQTESRSVNNDMKAQLKFWARAVALNVRQEC
ncbi:hypothetical protein Sjap_000363 [Stephania japonica]|uniref:Uncharacterized protein n=1 Tax=Stephania japonica TaxID=461633 RepID=A0AAP0KJH0_9MAGN